MNGNKFICTIYSLSRNFLITIAVMKTAITGSQIQITSLRITSKPRLLKNPIPIGETSTGR
jgi:hypothetical protein